MREAAEGLEFERAAEIRDRMRAIEERLGPPKSAPAERSRAARAVGDRAKSGRGARRGRSAGR
jgi:hypothetical protein